LKCPLNGKPCSKYKPHAVSTESGSHMVCEDCMASNPDIKPVDELGPCARCGATIDQIVRNSRIGCSDCYEHFAEPLSYIIAAVQFGGESRHVGSVPETHKRGVAESLEPMKFATELAQKVKLLVRAERYEEASVAAKTLAEVKAIMERGDLGPEGRAEIAEIAYRHLYPGSAQ
jgi:protein arginine kinase activator